MVDEGLINTDEAIMMVEPQQLDSLLHPMFDAAQLKAATPITTALPASPGAATGTVVFSAEEAIEEAAKGKQVILVRLETSPEDIQGHGSRTGHSDSPGRHDQPRSCCSPWHGYLLCIRCRRHHHR